MTKPINNLNILLQSMQPELHDGVYVFATLPETHTIAAQDIIASIREREGLSVVVAEQIAQQHDLPIAFRAAWITLTVHSDLAAVGLTAAFASALGAANISCNVVAGCHHDHIFVPHEQANLAMQTLWQLQQNHFQAA